MTKTFLRREFTRKLKKNKKNYKKQLKPIPNWVFPVENLSGRYWLIE